MSDIYIKIGGVYATSKPLDEQVILDLDKDGKIVGVEVLGAKEVRVDGQKV